MQPLDSISSKQEVMRGVVVGDQIEIETKTGERQSIIVLSVSETHIESGDEQFAIEDVEIIGFRNINMVEKGAGVAVGLTLGALTSALITALVLVLAF